MHAAALMLLGSPLLGGAQTSEATLDSFISQSLGDAESLYSAKSANGPPGIRAKLLKGLRTRTEITIRKMRGNNRTGSWKDAGACDPLLVLTLPAEYMFDVSRSSTSPWSN